VIWVESPTSSISTTLKDFWEEVRVLFGGSASPAKYGLNWTMPAVVNNNVGSPTGIKEELETLRWPFDSKNFKNDSRISLLVLNGKDAPYTVKLVICVISLVRE
jgi:hypothetical protein